MTDEEDQREREQLHELSKLLIAEKITSEEYSQRKAELLGTDEDIPDPDPPEVKATPSRPDPPEVKATWATPSRPHRSRTTETHEEQVSRHLKTIAGQSRQQTELLFSIRGWVMFFGVLAILSIFGWLILIFIIA